MTYNTLYTSIILIHQQMYEGVLLVSPLADEETESYIKFLKVPSHQVLEFEPT